MQSHAPNKTNIGSTSENDFVEFHKKKRSYWLLASTIILFVALVTFVYAFQTQSKYKKMIVNKNQKEMIKLAEIQSDSENNVKMTEDVRNTKLFFQNEKQIFLKSPLDGSPEELLIAETYAVSSDGSKLAFYRGEMTDNNGYFAVLDVSTKKESEYKLKEYEMLRGLEWSPDDKYILINYGSSMYGSTHVYDLQNKVEIGSFGQYRENIWINDNELITGQANREINNRFVESGDGSDIVKISINRPENPTVILSADPKNDYYSIKLDEKCLVVRVDSVKNEGDWEKEDRDARIKSEYKCYNLSDKTLGTYDYDQDADKLTKDQILKVLMLEKDKLAYVNIIKSNISSDYKIAYVQKGSGSIYDGEIFLLDPNNVVGTIFLLGQGAEIYWRKI